MLDFALAADREAKRDLKAGARQPALAFRPLHIDAQRRLALHIYALHRRNVLARSDVAPLFGVDGALSEEPTLFDPTPSMRASPVSQRRGSRVQTAGRD